MSSCAYCGKPHAIAIRWANGLFYVCQDHLKAFMGGPR